MEFSAKPLANWRDCLPCGIIGFSGDEMEYVTLLLVDDDSDLLCLLQRRLEQDGYDVIAVEGGRQALLALERHMPDLAVLDVLMPEMDGFQLAEQIKRRGDLPIIFLTSVAETRTRVEAIRRYAEDYVVKPFDYAELLARVQRVLRRTAGTTSIAEPLVVVDDGLSLNLSLGEAHTPAGTVKLSVTEAKLLYHLVRNAGQTLPVGTLVAKIWGYADEAGPEALRVAIHRLRRKLEPDPAHPRYILTERDLGYRFVAVKRR
jgi:two-component system, OmpR family, alkaline phosphatase synthesis response regulator PhoP